MYIASIPFSLRKYLYVCNLPHFRHTSVIPYILKSFNLVILLAECIHICTYSMLLAFKEKEGGLDVTYIYRYIVFIIISVHLIESYSIIKYVA